MILCLGDPSSSEMVNVTTIHPANQTTPTVFISEQKNLISLSVLMAGIIVSRFGNFYP